MLPYILDAAKPLDVKCHDIISSQETVQLLGNEICRRCLVGFDAVNNEIKVIRKRLDLWLISRFETIFDGQIVEFKCVQQKVLYGGYVIRILTAYIDP